jgi:ectoine hydroxylase-related dioxygenase (phytanoyl-CoA dioxygenase family)
MNNHKIEYAEKGVIVLPNIFTHQECDEIKRQAYLVKDEEIKRKGYPHNPSEQAYNKRSLIFFPAICNEYLNKIRIDSRLQNIVKDFIGDNVRQINNQIYFRESGDYDQFAWHQDVMFREEGIFKDDVKEDYFQTIIAIDDIHLDNGAIEFVEGSHKGNIIKQPKNLRVFERGDIKGKKYIANKGSVLIWSVMIIHGSEPNQSNSDRMTYMNGFCRTKSSNKYPHYLIDGQVVEMIDTNLIP